MDNPYIDHDHVMEVLIKCDMAKACPYSRKCWYKALNVESLYGNTFVGIFELAAHLWSAGFFVEFHPKLHVIRAWLAHKRFDKASMRLSGELVLPLIMSDNRVRRLEASAECDGAEFRDFAGMPAIVYKSSHPFAAPLIYALHVGFEQTFYYGDVIAVKQGETTSVFNNPTEMVSLAKQPAQKWRTR